MNSFLRMNICVECGDPIIYTKYEHKFTIKACSKVCKRMHGRVNSKNYYFKHNEAINKRRNIRRQNNVLYAKLSRERIKINEPKLYRASRIMEAVLKHKLGHDILINRDYVYNLLCANHTCFYCKCDLVYVSEHGKTTRQKNLATIDRVDSSRGYFKDNIVVSCQKHNMQKSDNTKESLQLLLDGIKRFEEMKNV